MRDHLDLYLPAYRQRTWIKKFPRPGSDRAQNFGAAGKTKNAEKTTEKSNRNKNDNYPFRATERDSGGIRSLVLLGYAMCNPVLICRVGLLRWRRGFSSRREEMAKIDMWHLGAPRRGL